MAQVTPMDMIGPEPILNCLLCEIPGRQIYEGLKDRLFGGGESFNLRQCRSCGLLWLDPRPGAVDLQKYYDNCFTAEDINIIGQPRPLTSFREAVRESIICEYYGYRHFHQRHVLCRWGGFLGRISFLRSRAINELGELFPLAPENRDALMVDIGCGLGAYLKMMQQLGWKVLGIEPHPGAVAIAEGKGLSIFKGTIEAARLPDNLADYIAMNHVLEHIADPISTIKECFRVLKAGGRLVIQTPNAGSLGHRVFKDNWRALDPPRHLFVFSSESIDRLFRKSPFVKVCLKTITRSSRTNYDNSILISRKGKTSLKNIKPQKGRNWFTLKESILCHLGKDCGEGIEVVAIK